MIICVCRRIKESDFKTKEELLKRIMESDLNCGQCLEYLEQHTVNQEKVHE